ncbi:Uma2 family endonuclease [Streptomyces sp. NBC_00440]|uniref:Uma2 family endonuclease n=1 Tax=unclassified Streptomyces TaxID=2593676 RepID=UPI002E22A196|nr:Uma2 family endonuclease [Streptomyces sp. NBC_00932]
MSAAAVEHPCDGEPPTLLEEADLLMEQLPGYRVEIIGGILTVTPPPDGPHAEVLTTLMVPFLSAGLHNEETKVLQSIGLWLPRGAEDYAIPDLAIVDGDYAAHLIAHNCYDPVVFRLVLEVTSSNYNQDLRAKVSVYAEADIPVYVIVNRKHNRVHVLTEPVGSDYASHQIFAAGQQAPLPASIGGDVTLDVAAVLQAGATVRAKD